MRAGVWEENTGVLSLNTGLEMSGLYSMALSCPGVNSGAGDLWDWDVAASVGDGRQD